MSFKKMMALVIALMMVMTVSGVVASADEVYVTNDTQLREAVLDALGTNDGSTIVLAEGEYKGLGFTYGEIRGKEINFKGEGNVVIDCADQGIELPWVTASFENITFTDNGEDITDAHYSSLIFALDSNMGYPCDLTFKDCSFLTSGANNNAIFFGGDADFYNCYFKGENSWGALNYCCPSGDGIEIDGCTFEGTYNWDAIQLAEGDAVDVAISNCEISAGNIEFGSPENIIFSNNVIETNTLTHSSNTAVFDGNTFGENAKVQACDGTIVMKSTNTLADGKTVADMIVIDENTKGTVLQSDPIAMVAGQTFDSLQKAVDYAEENFKGEKVTVLLTGVSNENVVIDQENDTKITIKGIGDLAPFSGNFVVRGFNDKDGLETVTFDNITFDGTVADVNLAGGDTFIYQSAQQGSADFEVAKGTNPHNVTISNCKFIGPGADVKTVCGVKLRLCNGLTVKNVTATGLHTFIQGLNGGENWSFENVEISDCQDGLSFKSEKGIELDGVVIDNDTVGGYGIRIDGVNEGENLVIKNSSISAWLPVMVRSASKAMEVTVDENTTMTASGPYGWCAVSSGSKVDDKNAPVTPSVNITVNAPTLPLPYGYVGVEDADGNVTAYKSFADALANANVTGNTITLSMDAELSNLSAISPGNALYASIDLNGNTLTVKQDSITPHGVAENPVIISNGKLVIDDITTGSSGVFWAKQGVDLILDNVEVVSNNVKATALFATEGDTNIEIIDSKITVNGFEGTAVFSNLGEFTVDNTDIVITDSDATGFLQKATIQNGSKVTMTNVTEGFKVGANGVVQTISDSDVKIDGAYAGITLYKGTGLTISEGTDIVITNTAIGVYNRSDNVSLNVAEGSTLTKESTVTLDTEVTVGGTRIEFPGLKDLVEDYMAANPDYRAEGEVLFTVNADIHTPEAPVGKEGQTVEYFDIMPVIGDKEVVLPAGTTQKVTFTLGEKINGSAEVYHYDGTKWESVAATTSGNKVTFTASSFSPYAVAYKSIALDESEAAKSITAEIVPTSDERVYDVVVKADTLKINRFRSAELDINFAGDKGMNYKVEGVGNVQVIYPETSKKSVYEFNLNGTGANFITSEYITIAQVKIFGHGSAVLKLDENAFNMVYTTKGGTETVEQIFTPANADAKLNVNTDEIDIEIAPEEKILKVSVKFDKNKIVDNKNEYQQLYVRIYGGDLDKDIVYNLGDGSGEVALKDNEYTMSTPLRMGLIYNVEVSGAGYRTFDHQVIMTGNKELTFWNNLKGGANDPELKIDKDAADTDVYPWTLLEGDVVMDYTVDIYDLSAVVSYFNRDFDVETVEGNKYAAYDINRDGRIDAVDIGRVLNSWGK